MKIRRIHLIGLLILATAAYWLLAKSPLPFDSETWKLDRNGKNGNRWRMRNDLIAHYKNGEVQSMLWVDANLGDNYIHRAMYRSYRLGPTFPPVDSWWLDVASDPEGKIIEFKITPD